MWFVYVLKTTGKCRSTAPYHPLQLAGYIAVSSEQKARTLEKYFKTGSGKVILKKRILNDEDIAKDEVWSDA